MDSNWADLLLGCPWAKRVHGVEGSDAAHKECARLAEGDRFISIDGDNIIDPTFFDQSVQLDDKSVYSWSARNSINGLVYGNGGIKCWPTATATTMRTHEIAETPSAEVDFCWDTNYVQIDDVFSVAEIHHSPQQAWRAGFREGVKMCLNEGVPIPRLKFERSVYRHNYERLLIWCSVGADVPNGLWAMYGARMGALKVLTDNDWDYRLVRDFTYLKALWTTEDFDSWTWEQLTVYALGLSDQCRNLCHLPIATMSETASTFFKAVYHSPSRVPTS